MITTQLASGLRDELTHFQEESLTTISTFALGLGYVWFVWIMTPVSGESIPINAWIGIGTLLISCSASHLLKNDHLTIARRLLVTGILVATACAAVTFPFAVVVYLFILPIQAASVLLSRRGFFLMIAIDVLLTVVIGTARAEAGMHVFLSTVMVPLAIILLVTIVAWLSVRNLWTALEWFHYEYRRAHHNGLVANEREAELRQALKSLDEATETLSRTNYMLTVARRQAEEARRLKQQFAQTISHELRTPLNLIVGFTELMIQSPERYGGQLPQAYTRDLSIVYRNACHLQDLVNDVIDLARIEAAQMSLIPEEIDPGRLVQQTVDTARGLAETHNLAVHTQIGPDLPRIVIDPTRIRQVLFNLLNNAVNWTERGSITVSVYQQDEDVVFAVADTGVGIAADDIPCIFEEFRQLDTSTRRRQSGAGLGLAISKQFVELHGGHIWVESQLGTGSTFYFDLPVTQTKLGISFTDISSAESSSDGGTPVDSRQLPVLLAITRSLSAASLLNRYVQGCRTVTVPDVEKGRLVAQQLAPQILILDQACEELQSLAPAKLARDWGLPYSLFVACTLPGEESLRQRLAVNGYLIKPVTRQRLWDTLRPFGEHIDKVLVVDDDVDFVRMLSRMLDRPVRRYQVISAYSGQEALSVLDYHIPDLILLDLYMPDIDGFQVIERIRSNASWRHIPIVVVSAQDAVENEAALNTAVSATRADGLMPGELVQWIQHMVNMATRPRIGHKKEKEAAVFSG